MIGSVVINAILENEGIKRGTFAKSIGITPTQIYDLLNGKIKRVSDDIANKIISAYPNYSKAWILTGEGDMFISYTGSNLNTFLTYTGLSQIEFAKKTDIDIIELYKVLESRMPISNEMVDKIVAKFPNVNKEWLLNGEGNMLLGDDDLLQDLRNELLGKYYTKLLPTSAVGGSLIGLQADGVFDYQCEKVVSPIPEIDFAMQVYGDSMSPVYPNGSRVFIKKVNPDIFIEYNRIYVLDTSNGVIIKKVMPSEKEGHIKCISLNEEYLPFEVHMNEIHGWYKVLGCLTLSI